MSDEKLQLLRIKIPPGSAFPGRPELEFESFLKTVYKALPGVSFSMEIRTAEQYSTFQIRINYKLASLLESLLYAQFREAEIESLPEQSTEKNSKNLATTTLDIELVKSDIYPIKTFPFFENESLASLFAILEKLKNDQSSIIQFTVKPLKDNLHLKIKNHLKLAVNRLKQNLSFGHQPVESKKDQGLFKVSISVSAFAKTANEALALAENIAKSYIQFDQKNGNSFRYTRQKTHLKSFCLTPQELASVFHFPNPDRTPHIAHVVSRKAEPPQGLPKSDDPVISKFGTTNFHNEFEEFGINRTDRRRHLYIIGKSGVGKSKLIELLIQKDILNGHGVAVLDPHGDLVDNILAIIPENRLEDVIYFNPADIDFPIPFNPLENVSPEYKTRITIGFIDIFKKLFGTGWTSRLEHVLRYTTLALLDTPGTTVLSIQKILTDRTYRQKIVAGIQDQVVKDFWVHEFAGWSEKFDNEAITPLLNKIGQFVSNSMIRNIIGQPHNTFDFREIMDNKKIILMKVSKGMLGTENASLLGSMLITKIQQAAMSRADIPESDRQDFYFYVDEFQNFATDTFAEILSEARKYRLNLTIAHQYMGQLSDTIRKTVFGNVGNMISFRVGAEDAEILAKEFNPVFKENDIINLGIREFYIKMSIDGELSKAFSGRTNNMEIPASNISGKIIESSQKKYNRPVTEIENLIQDREFEAPML